MQRTCARAPWLSLLVVLPAIAACSGSNPTNREGGTTDASGGPADARIVDAGAEADAIAVVDAAVLDAPGPTVDAAVVVDARPDAPPDAAIDAGPPSCAATPWTSVMVDQPVRLDYNGPSAASNGTVVRIATPDNKTDRLRVSNRTAGGWQTEPVGVAGNLPMRVTHVMDAAGRSYIAAHYFVDGLHLFEGGAGSYAPAALSLVGDTELTGGLTGRTLVIDPAGALHLLYFSDQGRYIAVRPRGGTWTNTALAAGMTHASLALDGTTLRAAHEDTSVSAEFYKVEIGALAPGASWESRTLAGRALQSSIAVDASHTVHVAYVAALTEDLIYARRPPGAAWTFETVDAPGSVGWRSSIVVEPSGTVHIVYQDGLNGLKEAVRAPGATAWTITIVDPDGSKGDAVVDPDGTMHAAYYVAAAGAVRWATRPPCR